MSVPISPNPSSDVIVISLNIEKTVQDAKIVVYDLNGKIMSSINVKEIMILQNLYKKIILVQVLTSLVFSLMEKV